MSKVVFVGNVPYNMGEECPIFVREERSSRLMRNVDVQEQLIDVFKSVGEVIGFRLVFDRDTGKPKGYGFCEFADHETAASAVRNLNNFEVGGRPLRIDLADSDPLLEGKTTVRGELVDTGGPSSSFRSSGGSNNDSSNSFLANLPPGVPVPAGSTALDVITTLLGTIKERDMMDVLAHMKAFVITHPEKARALLIAHPQLAYALFQALLVNRVVDESILQRMLAATGVAPTPTPAAASVSTTPLRAHTPQVYTPPFVQGQFPPYGNMPPPSAMFPQHQAAAAYYGRPPIPGMVPTPPPGVIQGSSTPVPSSTPISLREAPPAKGASVNQAIPAGLPDEQKQMLMQVLSMTPAQINALPVNEQAAILQLRAQFMSNAS
ncbi:hypothetical protein VKT23_009058 [Stygiomarasmius scandens]|uniref:RRM domain-containing protein n=1 Tax=Marasmiellus scandens TaxID=2682957 RepID=A0ABR1JH78_9AGAR